MNLRDRINARRRWWSQLSPWYRFSVAVVGGIYLTVAAVCVVIGVGAPRVEDSLQWDIGPDESCRGDAPGVCLGGTR